MHVAEEGGSLICQSHNDEFDDEPLLTSDMIVGSIADLEQEKGVNIIYNDEMGYSAPK